MRIKAIAAAALGVPMLAGCVQVAAPEEAIVINLNIRIEQEVVVRLQQDVRELINREEGDF